MNKPRDPRILEIMNQATAGAVLEGDDFMPQVYDALEKAGVEMKIREPQIVGEGCDKFGYTAVVGGYSPKKIESGYWKGEDND